MAQPEAIFNALVEEDRKYNYHGAYLSPKYPGLFTDLIHAACASHKFDELKAMCSVFTMEDALLAGNRCRHVLEDAATEGEIQMQIAENNGYADLAEALHSAISHMRTVLQSDTSEWAGEFAAIEGRVGGLSGENSLSLYATADLSA